jgi:Flp pilus assembly pilin Flp
MIARFLREGAGTVTVEYLVLGALATLIVGAAVYSLFTTLRARIGEVNNSL